MVLTLAKHDVLTFLIRISPDNDRFKDGETLTGNSDYVLSEDDVEHTFTLVLPSAKETHAGTYSVKASNEHGFDESSVSL